MILKDNWKINLKHESRKEKTIPVPGKEKYRSKVPVSNILRDAPDLSKCCEQVLYSCICYVPGAGMGFSFLISFLRLIFQFSSKIMFIFILVYF